MAEGSGNEDHTANPVFRIHGRAGAWRESRVQSVPQLYEEAQEAAARTQSGTCRNDDDAAQRQLMQARLWVATAGREECSYGGYRSF